MKATHARSALMRLRERLWQHPYTWLLLCLSLLILAVLLLVGFPLSWAIPLHAYGGYYYCLILFALLLYTTWGVLREVNLAGYAGQHWRGLLCVLLASVFVHLFQPHIMRVYNDEPGHQMVAKMMHEERENSVPEVGYALSGGMEYGERSLNYRMYFYSFLVSILHDLTGYRPANGVCLNGGIGLLLFLLVYLGGNRFYPRGGGVLAVSLLASLPLLDESVTSYGYDVTNLAFLAAYFLALLHYAESRKAEHLNWAVVLGLGLAYSRNESGLYLILVALVFGILWLRDAKVRLTFLVTISPLFLVPVLAARRIFQEVMVDLPSLFPHLTDSRFFALEYIPDNLIRVGQWMFDFSTTVPSSPILVLLGFTGLLALWVSTPRKAAEGKRVHPQDWVLIGFGLIVIGSFTLITLALFWNPVSGEAVRFLLPIHLLMVYVAVWFLANLNLGDRVMPLALMATLAYILLWAIPTKMRETRGANLVFAQYAAWAVEWTEGRKQEDLLYLSQLHTLFLLHGHPAVDLRRGGDAIESICQLVAEGYYAKVLVFIIEQYDAATDTWAPVRPALPLDDAVLAEVVDERRWAFDQRARFLRVTGYRDAEGQPVLIEELRPVKHDFNNFNEYWGAMRRLHPGLIR